MTRLADPMRDQFDTFEIERALEAYAEATRIVASARVVRGFQGRIRREQERGGVSRAVVSLRACAVVLARPAISWGAGPGHAWGFGQMLRMPSLLALLLMVLTLGAAVGGAGAWLAGRPDGPLAPGPVVPAPLMPGPVVPGPLVPGPVVPGPAVPQPQQAVPPLDVPGPDIAPSLLRDRGPSPAPSPRVTVRAEAMRTPADGPRGERRRAREQRRLRAAEQRRTWLDGGAASRVRLDGCVRLAVGAGSRPLAC